MGPAVPKLDWIQSAGLLGKTIGQTAIWQHDSQDPILYLTSPSNLLNDLTNPIQRVFFNTENKSPVYTPNFLDFPIGIYNATFHMESHDVKNPLYHQYIEGTNNR